MRKLLVRLFKIFLNVVYAFLKLLPVQKNKVTFLSRESNSPSLDFRLIAEDLLKRRPESRVVFLCRRMSPGLFGLVSYGLHIVRQMFHIARSKACIIDTYIIPISILKHRRGLRIIQIWHAVGSVKQFGYQTLGKAGGRSESVAHMMDMHKNYTFALSGSDAMVSSFSAAFGVPSDRIRVIVPPKLPYLKEHAASLREQILSDYPALREKEVLLYVPTYRRDKDYEINDLIRYIDFSRFCLIVKGHPVRQFHAEDSRIFTCSKYTSFEFLAAADKVITDYSAISIEAAYLGKPVYFYVYDYEEYTRSVGLNIDIKNEMSGCVFEHAKTLCAALHRPYDFHRIRSYCNKYVADPSSHGLDQLASLVFEESEAL